MAKCKGPLMSLGASGTVGRVLTFSRRSSGQQVRFQKKPSALETPARLVQRNKISVALQFWRFLTRHDHFLWSVFAQLTSLTSCCLFVKKFLSSQYFYCAGSDDGRVWKINRDTMAVSSFSPYLDNYLVALFSDDQYVYAAGYSTHKIYKLDILTMSLVSSSAVYSGEIGAMCGDEEYLYFSTDDDNCIHKMRKSDLLEVAISTPYDGFIFAIYQDENYIFCGGDLPYTIFKFNKSDLSKISESVSFAGPIHSIVGDQSALYVAGLYVPYIKKYLKSNLSYSSRTTDSIGGCFCVQQDIEYIYFGSTANGNLYKCRKSDMVRIKVINSYGDYYSIATIDDSHFYIASDTTQSIQKVSLSDLSFVGEPLAFGHQINALDFRFSAGKSGL
jgi:hypothetical protein